MIASKPKRPPTEKTEKPPLAVNAPRSVPPATSTKAKAASAAASTKSGPGLLTSEQLEAVDDQHAATAFELVLIDKIDRNPHNPRRNFDEAKLRELAGSFQKHGVLEPIIIRPKGVGRFELVAGERRWRAAQLAGLDWIPASVRKLSDAAALEVAILENLQREDLDAIEEAIGFRQAMLPIDKGGLGYGTQEALAEKLKCSQGHVANRLRLLDLPECWQQRVITREIPPTHARSLLPWVGYKELVKVLEKKIATQVKEHGGLPSLKVFEDDVEQEVWSSTEPISGSGHEYFNGRYFDIKWKFTDEQLADPALRVITIKQPWGDKTELRSLNEKLAKKWREQAVKAAIAKLPKGKGGSRIDNDDAGKPKPKRSPAEERAAKKKRDEAFAKRLHCWKIDWLAWLCSEVLGLCGGQVPGIVKHDAAVRMLLVLLGGEVDWNDYQRSSMQRHELDEILAAAGEGKKRSSRGKPGQNSQAWSALPDENALAFAIKVVRRCLFAGMDGDEPQPGRYFKPADIEALAQLFEIDLAREWREERAGPWTKSFFEMHDKAGLLAIAEQWQMHIPDTKPKGTMVQILMSSSNPKPIPKELLK